MARPSTGATLPPDYAERVYAGVLGKMIGVYLGRPFENWRHDRILDWLTWDGAPDALFTRPAGGGQAWLRAWVNGVDACAGRADEVYRLIHGEGTGLMIQGTREWTDYRVSAPVTPHMVRSAGMGVRVQGMRRYYALLLGPRGRLQLVKALDGIRVLAERSFAWRFGATYALALEARGRSLRAFVDGELLLEATDDERPLEGGAVAMLCEEGRAAFGPVRVQPVRVQPVHGSTDELAS